MWFTIRLGSAEIAQMETQFRFYEKLEKASLYYCLGGNLSQAQRAMMPDMDDDTRRQALREFFENLNAERVKQWQRQKP